MEENDDFNKADLFERAKEYVNTTIELKKLTVIHAVVKMVGSLASGLILVVVGLFFLVFLSVAFALYLGEVLSSAYQGFFIVALFYFILAVVIALMSKNYIQNPLINKLISKILKKGE